jgi:ParB-like chromosome segregation protein Spo0J
MTPAFKVDVQRRLDDLGWTRQELAKRLKTSKSSVTQMLGPTQTSSVLVPRVAQLLDIPMPVLGTDAELAELIRRLPEEKRAALLVIVKGMQPDPPDGEG